MKNTFSVLQQHSNVELLQRLNSGEESKSNVNSPLLNNINNESFNFRRVLDPDPKKSVLFLQKVQGGVDFLAHNAFSIMSDRN